MSDIKTYYNNEGPKGAQVVCELKLPDYHATPEAVAKYEKYGKRILWIDSNVVPGAFQMNSSWYFHPNKPEGEVVKDKTLPATQSHVHEDADEIVAFYGSDPEHPEELNGEIEFWIDGERYVFTKSVMVFLPAGMPHGPLFILKVDKPIFHYSVVTSKEYKFDGK